LRQRSKGRRISTLSEAGRGSLRFTDTERAIVAIEHQDGVRDIRAFAKVPVIRDFGIEGKPNIRSNGSGQNVGSLTKKADIAAHLRKALGAHRISEPARSKTEDQRIGACSADENANRTNQHVNHSASHTMILSWN